MKYLIFATAIAMTLSSFATAAQCAATWDRQDIGRAAKAGTALKLSMGPTSAPHFPGGTGEPAPQNPPKVHHKLKHRHHHN
jgi:hypothetical protein